VLPALDLAFATFDFLNLLPAVEQSFFVFFGAFATVFFAFVGIFFDFD
jgi:hypothetical protein